MISIKNEATKLMWYNKQICYSKVGDTFENYDSAFFLDD